MEQYDFDRLVSRKGTGCVKVDGLKQNFGREDLIPLWVADMDFLTPSCIVDAVKERCRHEVFGYTFPTDAYYESVMRWVEKLHRWKIRREWMTYIPGIVKGIGFAVQCFTSPGDKVIIQPPVYHPFRLVPEKMGRTVAYNPLKTENGTYRMDFEQLESLIDEKCKLLILCNPHNPGGIVWDKETLVRLAEICRRHGIIVVSDEIHSEIIYSGHTHHSFPTVSEDASACSITFMAPSKTFNMAGIVSSYAIVPDDSLRRSFFHFLEAGELNSGHLFAYIATSAAYDRGDEWRKQMITYVEGNVRFIEEFLRDKLPCIKIYRPEASFLVWMDCRELGLSQPELVSFFINKAKLALNDGSIFGPGGEGYMRLNIGCPRSVLERALQNLRQAVGR